jgi:photosystem II stability/assembly factor-like uncharacterized protein
MTRTSAMTVVAVCGLALGPSLAAQQPQYKGIFEPVSYPEDIWLTDVFFVSDDVGWVSGAAGTILHTKDGGATWTPQLGGDPQSEEGRISDLHFIDGQHGWAYHSGGKLLRTTDGETWEVVNARFSKPHYAEVVFTSPNDGVYISGDKIFRSSDGGRTWTAGFSCAWKIQVEGMTRNVACHLEELHFPTANVGYALSRQLGPGLWGIVKTEDGGATWNAWTVAGEVGAKDGSVFFVNENTGYAVLYGKKLQKTTDGGRTWTGVAATVGQRIRFADPEVGWSPYYSNGHHLAWTTDGGRRWMSRPVPLPSAAQIYGFSTPSRRRAYVVGEHGMIYRYRLVLATEPVPAKVVAAPAMPPFESPLDDQVATVEQQVDALQQQLEAAASASTPAALVVETCCAQSVNKLQATVDGLTPLVQQFFAKYRNLNLIVAGLQLVGVLPDHLGQVKAALQKLRQAKGPAAATAALGELNAAVDALQGTTRQAFQQQPLQVESGPAPEEGL